MPMEVRCPGCSRTLRVPDTARGKRIRCPRCNEILAVDEPASTATLPAKPPPSEPAPRPAPETDPFASNAAAPFGKTQADAPAHKAAPNEVPRSNLDVTGEFTPDPEAPDRTQALEDGFQNREKSDATSMFDESKDVEPGRRTRVDDGADAALPYDMPKSLGGYDVLKLLGRGGMGTVYLGRQNSLDRLVALKVMNPDKARNAGFVARFTREAYAAAQLVHHNVVQIYDIGEERGTHFFSMEFVKGEALMDQLRREKKLDAEVAVGYVLQAARGLKFGHDMGMVHRDVKPDNLLINDQGIVKVADLGLVKVPLTPGSEDLAAEDAGADPGETAPSHHATRVGVAVGTPTYMSPEQAKNAAGVDCRADIDSLGCTLYILLTGKPPFEGKTVIEVLTKHASAPIVPPDVIVKRVPKALSAILVKMMAKRPEDRYANMGEVIAALEKYLGILQSGAFTPREEHAIVLEQCVKRFNGSPGARLRGKIINGFLGGCLAVMLFFGLFGWYRLAGGVLGLAVLTPIIYLLIQGVMEKTYLFLKVREWLLGGGRSDLIYGFIGALLLVVFLHMFGLLWLWAGMGVMAIAFAVTFVIMVDRPLARVRKTILEQAEKLLRSLRLQGLEEGALRQFICKYNGKDGEELYEALFGYEAKMKSREWLRGEAAQRRRKYAAWRDPIIQWIDANQQARKEARERQHLQAVEAKALEAQGVEAAEAKQKAAQVADVMVHQAAEIKKEAAREPSPAQEKAAPAPMRQLLETAQQPQTVYNVEMPGQPSTLTPAALLGSLLGPKVRFLAGAVLLGIFVFWLFQNNDDDRLLNELSAALQAGDFARIDRLGQAFDMLPPFLGDIFRGLGPGIAGLILIVSVFFGGWRASLVALPAALIALLGPTLGIPTLGPLPPGLASIGIGVAFGIVAVLLRLATKKKPQRTPIYTDDG
ncbi:MAG: hypothetical protein FJ271_03190 [Planctomycetes bacterium]|nr:hypothetical protein [Planctomycetota bacterium]